MKTSLNPAIIITSPGDKRLACAAWADANFEQSDPFDTSPIYIVIPKNATDAAIAKLCRRFPVDEATLKAARSEPWSDRDTVNAALVAMCGDGDH